MQRQRRGTAVTLEEVAQHCQEGDVWVVVNDAVYDVSSFVGGAHPAHPPSLPAFFAAPSRVSSLAAGYSPQRRQRGRRGHREKRMCSWARRFSVQAHALQALRLWAIGFGSR
jgi:hypothetical protein